VANHAWVLLGHCFIPIHQLEECESCHPGLSCVEPLEDFVALVSPFAFLSSSSLFLMVVKIFFCFRSRCPYFIRGSRWSQSWPWCLWRRRNLRILGFWIVCHCRLWSQRGPQNGKLHFARRCFVTSSMWSWILPSPRPTSWSIQRWQRHTWHFHVPWGVEQQYLGPIIEEAMYGLSILFVAKGHHSVGRILGTLCMNTPRGEWLWRHRASRNYGIILCCEGPSERELGLHLFHKWFRWLNCPTQIIGLTSLL
jgi:hypothetical protein